MTDMVWLVGKIENTCMFLFHTCLYLNMKLIIELFRATFHPCYNSCIVIKKIFSRYFESQSKATTDCLSSHLYTNVMICQLKKFGSHCSVYPYCMKKILRLNFGCLFLPKKFKTLYSGYLALADNFLGTAGVSYRQV